MHTPIIVDITDDHPLAINGLQNMLGTCENIKVHNTYETGAALLEGLEKKQPDVLLLDIMLPDYSGQQLAEIIHKKYPQLKMLAVTSLDAPKHVKSMMRNGCSGYILKNTRLRALISAIEEVYNGATYIEASLKEQMVQNILSFKKPSQTKLPNLTEREKEILRLIVEEYTNQEIAAKLFISLRTVENHRFSLLQKLEVKNSIGLVRMAIQIGLVE